MGLHVDAKHFIGVLKQFFSVKNISQQSENWKSWSPCYIYFNDICS